MQAANVQETNADRWTWLALGIGLGLAVMLFGVVLARMGVLDGLGGETAVSPNALVLSSRQMAFGQDEIRVRVGETVTIVLDNADLYGHSFDVDEFDVHTSMPANDRVTATFTPTEPGTFTFYCGVPGHTAAGMVGTLIVEP